MTAQARQTQVVELLRRSERLQISELSAELGVSAMTIRRDLEALAREGLLRRVRGGAVSAISASYEPPFAARVRDHAEAKAAIGAAAAALLHDGETCIVDGGSTGVAIAEGLRGHENVTVCTPSLRVAAVLVDEPGIRLILTGGIVRAGERSLVGQLAEHAFGELRFDIMFLTGLGHFGARRDHRVEPRRLARQARRRRGLAPLHRGRRREQGRARGLRARVSAVGGGRARHRPVGASPRPGRAARSRASRRSSPGPPHEQPQPVRARHPFPARGPARLRRDARCDARHARRSHARALRARGADGHGREPVCALLRVAESRRARLSRLVGRFGGADAARRRTAARPTPCGRRRNRAAARKS